MSGYFSAPTADQLLADASNSVGARHRLRGVGAEMDLVVYGDRILAYCDEEEMPVALLRFGGPFSGTIWVGGELVGEYEKDKEGEFLVTEIEAGFKRPQSRRRLDPVFHLMGLLGWTGDSRE